MGRMCCGGRLGRSRSGSIFLQKYQVEQVGQFIVCGLSGAVWQIWIIVDYVQVFICDGIAEFFFVDGIFLRCHRIQICAFSCARH